MCKVPNTPLIRSPKPARLILQVLLLHHYFPPLSSILSSPHARFLQFLPQQDLSCSSALSRFQEVHDPRTRSHSSFLGFCGLKIGGSKSRCCDSSFESISPNRSRKFRCCTKLSDDASSAIFTVARTRAKSTSYFIGILLISCSI